MSEGPARRGGARIALLAVLGALAIAGMTLVSSRDLAPPPATVGKPRLMLLTSLPIAFGEKFGIDGNGSPALAALEQRFVVEPIAVADSASLRPGGLLLMAQPLAQPAEALVDLDSWVRSGGRVVVLADPLLEWPSERPLGDKLRPPVAFSDTGLLGHWGLTLFLPDERGPKQLPLGNYRVLTASPGSLSGACEIGTSGLVARCSVGKGRATVIADADFLNVGGPGALDGPTAENLAALVGELTALGPQSLDSP